MFPKNVNPEFFLACVKIIIFCFHLRHSVSCPFRHSALITVSTNVCTVGKVTKVKHMYPIILTGNWHFM